MAEPPVDTDDEAEGALAALERLVGAQVAALRASCPDTPLPEACLALLRTAPADVDGLVGRLPAAAMPRLAAIVEAMAGLEEELTARQATVAGRMAALRRSRGVRTGRLDVRA